MYVSQHYHFTTTLSLCFTGLIFLRYRGSVQYTRRESLGIVGATVYRPVAFHFAQPACIRVLEGLKQCCQSEKNHLLVVSFPYPPTDPEGIGTTCFMPVLCCSDAFGKQFICSYFPLETAEILYFRLLFIL